MIPFLHRLPSAATEDNPLWLIVLADMMTNLMLFFLVMYALSQQSQAAREAMVRTFDAKEVVDARPKPDEEKAKLDFAEKTAAERLKALFADTDVTEREIRVRLQNQVLFPSGRAELSTQADAPIAQLARVLLEMPNSVVIEGHTDAAPLVKSPYRSNWELSVARSNSVIERLVADGVPPARLVAAGYGEHRPAAGNETPDGRALNRRVEILIMRGAGGPDE